MTERVPKDLGRSGYWLLAGIVALAVLAGLYARFKGLGTWPFGVDEFYISRSIDQILRGGLPEFLCGGYYTRGLLYQYTVAGLRLADLSPEFAGRIVTAISSLFVLPAAYLLGRRVHSGTLGLVLVAVLSLSVWQVEMARFARMYAPFQAVFAWYLLFFLKYTVDGQRRAVWGMVLLSLLGILVWEGGALLGVVNLLAPFLNRSQGRLERRDWIYLAGMLVLLALLYTVATTDLRGFEESPDLGGAETAGIEEDYEGPWSLWATLGTHWLWGLLALAPAALAVYSVRWLWSLRSRWLAAAGLVLALAAAALHQFLLCAGIMALLLLTRLVDIREFARPPARGYVAALGACVLFWLAFGLLTSSWFPGAGSPAEKMVGLAYQFAGFPNVIDEFLRPWGRAIPGVTLGLIALIGGLAIAVIRDRSANRDWTALLIIVVVMILAISAAGSPRSETRYAYFLYPAMLTLAAVAVFRLAEWLAPDRHTPAIAAVACLGLFAASEDFQPAHLARIDTAQVNFRIDLPPAVRSHYYPRSDISAAAEWLKTNTIPEDIVISGIPNLDSYFENLDYFFLDTEDPRYSAYSCENGATERWTNLPLRYSIDSLQAFFQSEHRVIVVLYPDRAARIAAESEQRRWGTQEIWRSNDAGTRILELRATADE